MRCPVLRDERAESDAIVALPAVVAVMVAIAMALGVVVWWAAAQSAQAVADATAFQAISVPVLGTPAAQTDLARVVAAEAASRPFPPLACTLAGLSVDEAVQPATVTTTVSCRAGVPMFGLVQFQRQVTLGLNPSHLLVEANGS
jgi:hypothetical protein